MLAPLADDVKAVTDGIAEDGAELRKAEEEGVEEAAGPGEGEEVGLSVGELLCRKAAGAAGRRQSPPPSLPSSSTVDRSRRPKARRQTGRQASPKSSFLD